MTCDGTGWLVYEVEGESHHDVCYGCNDCDEGWCHEHSWALNICLMDHLEAGEGELIAVLCGEEIDGRDLMILMSHT
jgi:hypothetical protein